MNKTTKALQAMPASSDRQRGAALIVGLVLLVPVTLAATAVAQRNILDDKMAANQRDGMRALYIAESGAEQAIANLMTNGTWAIFNTVLADSDNLDLNQASFGGGAYTVLLVDNDDGDGDFTRDADGRVILRALGNFGTANREVAVAISRRGIPSEYAILTNKHLKINGDMQLTGSNSRVHSNTSIEIPGNPRIDGMVSSGGSISISGSPTLGGQTPNAPPVVIPHIYPPDFRADANLIFTKDCKVKRASDNVVLADASTGKWHGWDCASGDKWTMSDSSPSGGLKNGFIYVEGNAVISGSPTADWNLTLVAEGYIEVSGNPNLEAFGNSTDPHAASLRPEVRDVLFVAGNDLKINGNPSQKFYGVMAAHMEVAISGNPDFQGRIIAENGTGQQVTTGQTPKNIVDQNEFSGNPTQINNRISPWDSVGIRKVSWRESF